MLLPYFEQQAIYSRLSVVDIAVRRESLWWLGQPDGDSVNDDQRMTPADRTGLGSIPLVKCPTRRSGLAVTEEKDFTINPSGSYTAAGPITDYTIVILANNGAHWWHGSQGQEGIGAPSTHVGPFRSASFSGWGGNLADAKGWKPRDTFSWWSDGTSNQLVIGEKHVPSSRLEKCDSPVANAADIGDCSYAKWGEYGAASSARSFVSNTVDDPAQMTPMDPRNIPWGALPLAKGPKDYSRDTDTPLWQYGFGSYHPGTCNFLVGDGAVRGISVTTPVSPILAGLAMVNDGNAISIP